MKPVYLLGSLALTLLSGCNSTGSSTDDAKSLALGVSTHGQIGPRADPLGNDCEPIVRPGELFGIDPKVHDVPAGVFNANIYSDFEFRLSNVNSTTPAVGAASEWHAFKITNTAASKSVFLYSDDGMGGTTSQSVGYTVTGTLDLDGIISDPVFTDTRGDAVKMHVEVKGQTFTILVKNNS